MGCGTRRMSPPAQIRPRRRMSTAFAAGPVTPKYLMHSWQILPAIRDPACPANQEAARW
jgi:hypothetical protein